MRKRVGLLLVLVVLLAAVGVPIAGNAQEPDPGTCLVDVWTGFNGPWGMAIDDAQNLYVAEWDSHQVKKVTSEGILLDTWGSQGTAPGQFDGPWGVALDDSGNVFVSDDWNNRVQKFTSDGEFIGMWGSQGSGPGQFEYPTGLDVDRSGNVYVADWGNDRIQKFTNDGVFISEWGTKGRAPGQFDWPSDVAVNDAGNVYVADTYNDRIQMFNSDGIFKTSWGYYGIGPGQFSGPQMVAVDNSGNVYVSDHLKYPGQLLSDRVQKFTNFGAYIGEFGSPGTEPGQFSQPGEVVVDPATGKIHVADYDNDRIQVFLPCEPDVLTENLINEIDQLDIPEGTATSLTRIASNALAILEDENEQNDVAAVRQLGAFLRYVRASERAGRISEADADDLIAAAIQIIDLLTE